MPDVSFFVPDFFGIDEVDVSQKFKVSQVGGFVLVVDFAVADASFRFVEYFFKFPVGNRVVDKSGNFIQQRFFGFFDGGVSCDFSGKDKQPRVVFSADIGFYFGEFTGIFYQVLV